jgi:hypothetical protein
MPATRPSNYSPQVRGECLDVMANVLRRFGATGSGYPLPAGTTGVAPGGLVAVAGPTASSAHGGLAPIPGAWDQIKLKSLVEAALKQLADANASVRKRASAAVAVLAPLLCDRLLESVVGALVAGIEGGRTAGTKRSSAASNAGVLANADARTLVSTIGGVSRQVGGRLGRHLTSLVPLFLSQLGDATDLDEANNGEGINQLREVCLHALESVLATCGRELSGAAGAAAPAAGGDASPGVGGAEAASLLPRIVDAALAFSRFDPNLAYSGDDDAAEGDDAGGGDDVDMGGSRDAMDEDEGGGGDDDEDYGGGDDDDGAGGFGEDDGDSSWKVRRASVRVLAALVSSRLAPAGEGAGGSSSLAYVFSRVVPALVSRLKREREETVRLEVVSAATEAVRLAGSAAAAAHRAAATSVTPEMLEAPLQALGAATLPVVAGHAHRATGSASAAAGLSAGDAGAMAGGAAFGGGSGAAGGDVAMDEGATAAPVHAAPAGSVPAAAALALLSSAGASLVPGCLFHLGVTPAGRPAPPSPHLSRTPKTRAAVLGLLQRYILALAGSGDAGAVGGALGRYLPALFAVLTAGVAGTAVGAAAGSGPAGSPSANGGGGGSHPGQLRLDALATLHVLLLALSPLFAVPAAAAAAASLPSSAVTPAGLAAHLSALPPALASAAGSDWYRLSAQALRTAALTLTLLRPADRSGKAAALQPPVVPPAAFAGLVSPIATAVLGRLMASQAADQEVVDAALASAGVLLAHAGDVPPLTAPDTLASATAALAGRMRSDHTRATALRAVAYAATSPLHLPLAPPLAPAVAADFPGYLRQASKATRLQALATLTALVTASSPAGGISSTSRGAAAASQQLDLAALGQCIAEAAANVGEGDLTLAAAAEELALAVLAAYPPQAAVDAIAPTVLPRVLRLASSSLLTGPAAALTLSLLARVAALGAAGVSGTAAGGAGAGSSSSAAAPSLGLEALVAEVVAGVRSALAAGVASGGQATGAASGVIASAARSIGSLLAAVPPATAAPVASGLLSGALAAGGFPPSSLLGAGLGGGAGYSDATAPSRVLALRSLGAAGAVADLTAPAYGLAGLPQQLAGAFSSPSDDVRSSSAWALGSCAAGPGGAASACLPIITAGLTSAAAAAAAAAASAAAEAGAGAGAGSASSSSSSSAAAPSSSAAVAATETCYLYVSALRAAVMAAVEAAAAAAAASGGEGGVDAAGSRLGPHLPVLLPLLTSPHVAGSADVGVRTAVSETLGRLAGAHPDDVISALGALATSAEPHCRWTAATSLRQAATVPAVVVALARPPPAGSPASASGHANTASALLAGVVDEDVGVRTAALSAVGALAHAAPSVLVPLLAVRVPAGRIPPPPISAVTPAAPGSAASASAPAYTLPPPPRFPSEGLLAPLLYETLPRPDLVLEISMGPFTHRRDNGLPARKAAWIALDALLAAPPAAYAAAAAAGGATFTARDAIGPELLPLLVSALVRAHHTRGGSGAHPGLGRAG